MKQECDFLSLQMCKTKSLLRIKFRSRLFFLLSYRGNGFRCFGSDDANG
nr:MAG TPA: hypothetical protein [Caudoviricetes sp.]